MSIRSCPQVKPLSNNHEHTPPSTLTIRLYKHTSANIELRNHVILAITVTVTVTILSVISTDLIRQQSISTGMSLPELCS
jgi:hypothetical protein